MDEAARAAAAGARPAPARRPRPPPPMLFIMDPVRVYHESWIEKRKIGFGVLNKDRQAAEEMRISNFEAHALAHKFFCFKGGVYKKVAVTGGY